MAMAMGWHPTYVPPSFAPFQGWWKGKWWFNKNQSEVTDQDIPYVLTSTEDLICVGMQLQTVRQAIDARAATRPGSKFNVMYHTSTDDPTESQPKNQKLTLKHSMVWKYETGAPLKTETNKESSMDFKHVAGTVSRGIWDTQFTKVVWLCKWTLAGLTPVRPQVVMIADQTFAGNTALKLESSP